MNKKLLSSLSALLLTSSLVGGASFAEFSSQATSAANTFTAGTLNLGLSASGPTASGTAAWNSGNMKPGDEVTGQIDLTNTGTVDASHVYFYFNQIQNSDPELFNQIIVTSVKEKFNGTTTAEQLDSLKASMGINAADDLTVAKLFTTAFYSWDDRSGDGIILSAGDKKDYSLIFTFKFKDMANNNDVQGKTAAFTLKAEARQNSPTEGFVPLHQ
jgi:predicted ribosomally synthesized peptide with SipW-like signal peptide